MDSFSIEIGLPDPCLSPNGRAHWAQVHAAEKKLREAVLNTVRLLNPEAAAQRWDAAWIEYDFYFTTNRVRDDDNYTKMMKTGRDAFGPTRNTKRKVIHGLGIVPDDTLIKTKRVDFWIDKNNPRVKITLSRRSVASADALRNKEDGR